MAAYEFKKSFRFDRSTIIETPKHPHMARAEQVSETFAPAMSRPVAVPQWATETDLFHMGVRDGSIVALPEHVQA